MHIRLFLAGLAVSLGATSPIQAGVASKVVQEAVEYTARKFGKEAAEEGLEKLTGKMTALAAKHGDEVVTSAFKKVGPRAANVAVEAGEHGGVALRLLAKHGDEAMSIAMRPGTLGTVAKYGDEAAGVLIKHGTVGEQLVKGFGKQGIEALGTVTPQNGRRLAMMASEGTLKPELMTVVARYGDQACDFIWRNKGALALGTAFATFVAAPEEFLDGTQKLASVVGEAAVKPLATEAAKHLHWNLLAVLLIVAATVCIGRWTRILSNVTRVAAWWTGQKKPVQNRAI